jgi:uncharacterized protein YndB with AHSA1/START domain
MTDNTTTRTRYAEAVIEADPVVPMIHIHRDFHATPAQLMKAHTDPDLFTRWVGPNGTNMRIVEWDARTGGCWRYAGSNSAGDEFGFRGTFHDVRDNRIVQTFTWEAMPDDVTLETLTFEDLGDGTTRLHGTSLCDSFEGRDAWLASGMEIGVNEGYAKLDRLIEDGQV